MKKKVIVGLLVLFLIPFSAYALFDNEAEPDEVEKQPIIDDEIIDEEIVDELGETEGIISLGSILLEFDDDFSTVINGYDNGLQNIIDKASREYEELPYEERIKTSVKAKLISKYISEIGDLDKNVDKVFYYLIDELKERLLDNGYDLIIANDYIDRYKVERDLLHRKFLDNAIDENDK
ncbi:MAG: hypothetical protein U9Q80_01915 [Bacillota bacterium]|nr:hypothetical protein [Bacillota bacterium]